MSTILWEIFSLSWWDCSDKGQLKTQKGNRGEKISLPFFSSQFCSIFASAFLSYKCWAVALLIDFIKINLVLNEHYLCDLTVALKDHLPHCTSFRISHWYSAGTLCIIRWSRLSGFDYVSGESPRQTCSLSPCLGSQWLSFSARSCISVYVFQFFSCSCLLPAWFAAATCPSALPVVSVAAWLSGATCLSPWLYPVLIRRVCGNYLLLPTSVLTPTYN